MGFYFEDDVYLDKAHQLEFEDDQLYDKVTFENLHFKWIKNHYQKKVYFIPNYNPDHRFELITDYHNQNLKIKKKNWSFRSNDKNILMLCIKQTLVIHKKLYCFEETHYLFNDRKILIRKIFANSSLNWSEKERVKFIFNYKDNRLVFQTTSNLFVFNYANFKLNSNNEISYVDKFDFVKIKSCLLIKCEQSTKTQQETIELKTTTQQEDELKTRIKSNTNENLMFYIVFFILLFTLIFFVTFYLIISTNPNLIRSSENGSDDKANENKSIESKSIKNKLMEKSVARKLYKFLKPKIQTWQAMKSKSKKSIKKNKSPPIPIKTDRSPKRLNASTSISLW